ncbi:MAG: hypothetical protein ACJAT2_000807 [Bacteriovoracaceae bacterium]|jgi:hypothetical protein
MGTKPLIFLSPLSDRLNELKESIESTAEEENIEIYEIETLEELNQTIPHLGQFLLLTASPKHCAAFLQLNTRLIRKEQSKVILITNQFFPAKIVDRLNKLGLTDLILESVAPKTLQYKVKLQLRSITAQKEEVADILIKQDEEEVEQRKDVRSSDEKEEDEKQAKLQSLKDKILNSEKEKTYPGKASLVIEEDIDPDMVIGEPKEAEEGEKVSEPKTLLDVERETAQKKANLPWHKQSEDNLKTKSHTEKIDNVWSNKKEVKPSKDKESGNIEGKSSTDKLKNNREGKTGEKEDSIKTHWGGNLKSAAVKDPENQSDEVSNTEKLDKHYEGTTEASNKLNQDFKTAKNNFKEAQKDSMAGESKAEQDEGNLTGDSAATKMNNKALKNDSSMVDKLENDFKGKSKDPANQEAGNMHGEGQTGKINDELQASVEELRSLNKNASLKTDLSLDSLEDEDLKAESKGADLLERNLSNDTSADRLDHDSMGSRLKKGLPVVKDNSKRESLLEQVKKNRKKRENDKPVDGFMRSPNIKKTEGQKEPEENLDDIETAIPIALKKPSFSPSDFSSDLFEDDEGIAETEVQENEALNGNGAAEEYGEDLDGENHSEEQQSDLSGDSVRSEELEDLKGDSNKTSSLEGYQGESSVDKIEGDDLYGKNKEASRSAEEEEEQKKKRKKLEELYALKEKKLQELKEKKRKAAALSTEEDYYKKERDWDEKAFSMDNEKVKKEDEKLSEVEREKSDNQNLEAVTYERSHNENLTSQEVEKKENYTEEIIEQRSRHKREEIILDDSSLTDMERELLKSNKDWGEQTINYSKLKSGEDAISTDRESTDKDFDFKMTEKEIEKDQKIYKGSILDGDIQEEVEDEEEGDKVIHADSKGIESVIQILNLYFDKETRPSQVLNRTAELMNKEKGFGVVSFFYKKFGTEQFTEILNGHSLFSNDQRLEMWEADKELMVKNWASIKLPTWTDKTFRESKIDFIYPFYEGVDHLGFAVVNFTHGMKSENAQRIEITLEAARAVYLTQRHNENGEDVIYSEKKSIPTEVEKNHEEKGFMKGSDNLIFLEKEKAKKKALEIEKEKEEKPGLVKKLWNRMFG